ncbi:hypothetical protein RD792_001969 [Penstemon davidsonii]|uniref:Kinetochore protein NDC80 n=1 Tax=Penstemon davidsonii TaxID=160366 RepID=A0ABR0DPU0_9LAMI|nr:hypothetical protein RD792_001969 [Penstemon davidsonii]
MRKNVRRLERESVAPDRRPPPPTPTNFQFSTPVPGRRDSDASFCSSRPSIASSGLPNPTDRSYQISALRTINSYLASVSFPISLKHPLPSAKDITETLKFLVQRLGFTAAKLEDDIGYVLKSPKYPLKWTKSLLRAPGTPHSWPHLLAAIHWIVQILKYKEYAVNTYSSFEEDQGLMNTIKSYEYFISGEDEAMGEVDGECKRMMTEWMDEREEEVNGLELHVNELEGKLEGLKSGPSRKDVLEQNKADLEQDMAKLHVLIERLDGNLEDMKRKLEEKERALEEKVEHKKKICEENDELKRRIEEQVINLRDAERMKRELQAVERDIEESEAARNAREEKVWEIDSEIGHKFKELEQFVMDYNQHIRRLKLGTGFQFQLDAMGSTPAEVLGLDLKSVLKPALASYAEDIKRSSMEKLQELISLRQQSGEIAAKLEEKQNIIVALQSDRDAVQAQLNSMSKGAHEYASKCAQEASKMAEEVEMEAQKMLSVEKEAAEFLQETIVQTEEEVKLCGQELFGLINSVSAYKEYVGSKVARMKSDLIETAGAIVDMYKESRPPGTL